MHRCLRILPMPSGRRSRTQLMTMFATRPMVRLVARCRRAGPALPTSQKAWLRSVNKVSKLVQASIDKQTAKDKADKAAKAKAAKESEEKTKNNRRIQPSKPVN